MRRSPRAGRAERFGEHVDVAGPAAGDAVGGNVGEPQCFCRDQGSHSSKTELVNSTDPSPICDSRASARCGADLVAALGPAAGLEGWALVTASGPVVGSQLQNASTSACLAWKAQTSCTRPRTTRATS